MSSKLESIQSVSESISKADFLILIALSTSDSNTLSCSFWGITIGICLMSLIWILTVQLQTHDNNRILDLNLADLL